VCAPFDEEFATGGVTDEGRDHPGPGEGAVVAVSLVVTSLRCGDEEDCNVGLAPGLGEIALDKVDPPVDDVGFFSKNFLFILDALYFFG
jgi:hypothetical protein